MHEVWVGNLITPEKNAGFPSDFPRFFPEKNNVQLGENPGSRVGEEVLQLYIHDLVASRVRPVRELKGFQKAPFSSKRNGVFENGWMDEDGGWGMNGWILTISLDRYMHNLRQLRCCF